MTNQTVAKLGDFMPKELKKIDRTHETVEAVFLKRLYKAADNNATKVADLLGLTSTTVNSMLKDGKCKKNTELAARYVYERDYANDGGGVPKLRQAIITAEPHVIKTVKDLLTGLGGQCFVLPEKAGE